MTQSDTVISPRARSGALQRWAAFSVRHRWRVLGGWVAALVILAGVVAGAGGAFVDSFSIPGVESQQAIDLLEERFPSQAGDSAQIVVRADAGVNDPVVRPQIEALLAEAATRPKYSPLSPRTTTPARSRRTAPTPMSPCSTRRLPPNSTSTASRR